MPLVIREEPTTALADYASVSIAFPVHTVLDVIIDPDGTERLATSERALDVPYVKDYDATPEDAPEHWALRFDLTHWALFCAYLDGKRVGGAALAFDTEDLDMLEGRRDLAVLWDLRVTADCRGNGVGSSLFAAAERWAVRHRCRELKVETQNINVPACRFYAKRGCELRTIGRSAYPDLPYEAQLLWYKDLSGIHAEAGSAE